MPAYGGCAVSSHSPEMLSCLDELNVGCGLFDERRQLLFCNEMFREHGAYPNHLCAQGVSFDEFERFDQTRSRGDGGKERQIDRRCTELSDGGRVVLSIDVTDQQSCRIDLARATDAKENALRDLVATQRQLGATERLAALGELTAGVAHEIKNPLNFINNFAHVSMDLLDEVVSPLRPAIDMLDQEAREEVYELLGLVRQNLIKINQHGRRADLIVKTMLEHARKGPDNTQVAPLNDLVKEVVILAKQDIELVSSECEVDILVSLSPQVRMIECFPEDLVRALLNLVGNAIHATQQRQGKERPTVRIATAAIDNRIEITVEDNGIGMAKDVLQKVMTPFFTTKPPGEGTGLGLSLTHDVISRQHRGSMAIESEQGAFTKVTVTLFKSLPERRSGGRRRDDG